MKQAHRGRNKWTFATAVVLSLALFSPAAHAKKARPADPTAGTPGSSGDAMQQAQLAQMRGMMALAQVRVAKAGLAEEATIAADPKQRLGSLYDQEESTTKDGLAKLKEAKGDSAKVTAAAAIIDGAPAGTRKFMAANPTVNDALIKRMTIINNELSMIAKSPDSYVSALGTAGVTDPTLTKAKSIVRTAATRSGGKVDGDTTGDVLSARSQVRGLLSAKQARSLDAALSGGFRSGGAPAPSGGKRGGGA